ncbi:MAG: Peptidase M1 membrane alanine aminopeptidase [Bacteroidetes bacterium]|nr:Peptidase M1 membrane alanine aminopeptidase [Bacteroidota bacterium]
MNKKLSAILEYGALVLACVLLVAFIGTPDPEKALQTRRAAPAIAQTSEPWDRNLVLPKQGDRIANYTMDVKLDTAKNIVSGWEILEWKNVTGRSQTEFPFHLYHNAWKNNRSTFSKEGRNFGRPDMQEKDYGWTNVKSVRFTDRRGIESDITNTFRYIQPDDANPDDHTVFQVTTPRPVYDGQTLKLRIEFETKQPIPIARTGAIRNYHFVVQWFPKIGVWWKPRNGEAGWNCHQFHANTEFFADYGMYDVKINVPSNYVVGASGGVAEISDNKDGTKTHRFHQADIHDFAWLASPDLVVNVRTFSHNKPDTGERSDRHHILKDVKVILLTQPHHNNLIERYYTATFNALRWFGEWYGEYPYDYLTVVDPANDSRSGGMEYPTLFTGGGNMFAPKEASSPEGVTVHEFGHQFWYGLVGNNEFEEAWLDEGFNTYSTDRVMRTAWPPFKPFRYYFGGGGAGSFAGIPFVFHEVDNLELLSANTGLRRQGKNDVMARKGWEYYQSYGLNSYDKPGMSLLMLERYLGEEWMYRVMRTYHHRWRFKHPTSQDFINTVNEVTGKDMNWFFENTWFSSNVFDYSVDNISNRKIPPPEGVFNINGAPIKVAPDTGKSMYECEVIVKREGEAIAPVDVEVGFSNGDKWTETWDGQYRWKKFVYKTASPVAYVLVDPQHKMVMDVNRNNNSRVVRSGDFRSLSARKYGSKFLFWVQTYLEMMNYWN